MTLDLIAIGLGVLGVLIMIVFGLDRRILYKLGYSLMVIGSLYLFLFKARDVSPINWIAAGLLLLLWIAVLLHKSNILTSGRKSANIDGSKR